MAVGAHDEANTGQDMTVEVTQSLIGTLASSPQVD
jgi:hypothetical protein